MTKGHEKIVDRNPEVVRKDFLEGLFSLLRCCGRDQTESVRNAMDVGVDADCGDAKTQPEYEIGCLSADPGEGEESLFVSGDLAVVPCAQNFAAFLSWPASVRIR